MTDDIVERLRMGWGHASSDTLDEAAAEIERLEYEVEILQKRLRDAINVVTKLATEMKDWQYQEPGGVHD